MNQILYIDKNNKKKKSGTLEIKIVIKFFSIAIICFGVILLGSGSYAMYKNINQSKENNVVDVVPTVNISKQENMVKISVTHDKIINYVKYNWNDEEEKIIQGNNRNSIEEEIELRDGNNILYVTAVDVNGKQATYQKEFIIENGDYSKPNIELKIIGNILTISATDNKELNYITYRWNENEETKLDVSETEKTKIEAEVEIPKGENTLTVVAVDSSNNTQTKMQKFEGVTKPEINVEKQDDKLFIKISHDKGIQKVEFVYNGQNGYVADDMLGETSIEFTLPLVQGENKIVITAYSKENTSQTFDGICNY